MSAGLFEIALGGDGMDDGNHAAIIQCSLATEPDPHVPRYSHPYLLLTLTTLFWSGNMVIGRAVRADVPPLLRR